MRLIKLTVVTEYHGNFERYFDADKIENFSRLDDTTYLFMSASSSAFEVVETPEEIIELIKQAKRFKCGQLLHHIILTAKEHENFEQKSNKLPRR